MKIWLSVMVSCICLFCCCAKEKAPAVSNEKRCEELIELGPGAYSFKYDKSGALKSFVAVGRAKISTLFDKDGDLQTAIVDADLDARAWMVQVFDAKSSYSNSQENEQIVEMTAKGDDSVVIRQENGKSVVRRRRVRNNSGSAELKGLQKIGAAQKNGYYYVIYAWDRDAVNALKKLNAPSVKKPAAAPRGKVKSTDFVRATSNVSKYL